MSTIALVAIGFFAALALIGLFVVVGIKGASLDQGRRLK